MKKRKKKNLKKKYQKKLQNKNMKTRPLLFNVDIGNITKVKCMAKIDKVVEEKKIESMRTDYKEKPIVSPTFGKFPMSFWVEWEKDCEINYNGTRWMKAWDDHQSAKQSKKEEAMWEYMMKMNDRLDQVENTPVEEETKDESFVPTMGNPTPKKKKDGDEE